MNKEIIKNGWTPERRKRQSERIRQQKPWEHSTGPRSTAGKEASKNNNLKHGWRSAPVRELENILHEQRKFLRAAREIIKKSRPTPSS